MKPFIIFTCEHASNNIPTEYKQYFVGKSALMKTHEAYDIGAYEIFKYLKKVFNTPGQHGKWSRLLIDLNRPLANPRCFSKVTRLLSREMKSQIASKHYQVYWDDIFSLIKQNIKPGQYVLHIAVHSFTPSLNGNKRNADIGLLYDPKRPLERSFCKAWRNELTGVDDSFTVRMNYPYSGTSDGLSTSLRKAFPARQYAGIELELNQKLFASPVMFKRVAKMLAESIRATCSNAND